MDTAPLPRGKDALPWVFAFGVPFAMAAALIVMCTGPSKVGKEIERLERVGCDRLPPFLASLTPLPAPARVSVARRR